MPGSDNRIAEVRTRKNLKQAELARRIGMSRGQLANIESGTRKIDLPELRNIARALECQVVDLLLPEDAPNQPDEAESQLLQELRKFPDYDPRAVLTAAKAVVEAAGAVQAVKKTPANLAGDPALASALTSRWDRMDDGARKKALQLLDTARDFGG